MNKQELIKHLATNLNQPQRVVEDVLNELGNTIRDTVSTGGELSLTDVGKFSSVERAAKEGRNPKTGEPIQIAAKRAPKFTPAKALKDAVAA